MMKFISMLSLAAFSSVSAIRSETCTLMEEPKNTNEGIEMCMRQIEETKEIAKDNIVKVLERDVKLNDLDKKAEDLDDKAKEFGTKARLLQKAMWWKKNRPIFFGVGCVIIVIGVVVLVIAL